MEDYQGNSKSKRETQKPEKKVERVVKSEVRVQKRSIGRKFKDLFIGADPKSVAQYVTLEVLIPAARNMLFDALKTGSERMIFGETAVRRRNYGSSSRYTYNNPVNRDRYRDSPIRSAPPVSPEPRTTSRLRQDTYILTTREEAQLVLERMNDLIDTYEVASVADLHDLLGQEAAHTDNKWGWIYLADAPIRQVREGYLLDLPPAEPIA